MTEAAAQMADELLREVDEALRYAADVHDLAGKDEQRDRQERIDVDSDEQALRDEIEKH